MNLRIKSILVVIGIAFMILISLGAGYFIFLISQDMARDYPELAHMQYPVLSMAWSVLLCAIVAMVFGMQLMINILRNLVFEERNVKLLRGMGICIFAAILPVLALIIYTAQNVPGSITNLWAETGVFGLIILGIFVFLVTTLFEKAVEYKQENDLTV